MIYSEKSPQWTLPHIKSILRNEKYCGDVLMQTTFQQDVINRKVIKNTGQLPMYLIEMCIRDRLWAFLRPVRDPAAAALHPVLRLAANQISEYGGTIYGR